ncbi:MAG: MFS transporter, partial [Acidobacteriia bacterium]|nr:MFS transporter [Terriglobia bacterium]
ASWWAGERDWRLRLGILASFGMAAAGYLWLGGVTGLAIAMAAVLLAHAGSSINWVFSTTLLQSYTEDRFRGRVFAADTGLLTLGIAGSSYLAGVAIDAGVAPREIATALGLVMIIPGAAWAIIMSRK